MTTSSSSTQQGQWTTGKTTLDTQKKEASLSKWFRDHLNTKPKGVALPEPTTTTTIRNGKGYPSKSNSTTQSSSSTTPSNYQPSDDHDLADILREWIFVKTKLYVTLLGEKGLGKAFLVNTLLESTFQDTHALSQHASLDKDFFLVADNEAKRSHMEDTISEEELSFSYKDFPLPVDYDSSVNWSSEKEARNNVNQYCTTSTFNSTAADRYSFVIPQGPFGGILPRNYTLSYSKVFELHVTFMTERELRQELWKLHEPHPFANTPQLEYYRRQYKQILELSRDQLIPLPNIRGPEFLPIPKHIQEVLGQSFRFKGSGMDPNLDRIYIRERMLEITTRYGLVAKFYRLKVPSGILEGNKELTVLDSSSINEQTGNTTLQRTNLLLIAVDRRGLSDNICNLLRSSGFLDKLTQGSEEHKLVFVDLSEREEVQSLLSAPHMFYFKTKEQVKNHKQQLLSKLKKTFLEREQFSLAFLPNTERALEMISVLSAKPLLFSSLNLHKNVTHMGGHSLTEVKHKTSIPRLLANIQNMALSKCAKPLKDFNQDWMVKQKGSSPGLLDRISSFIAKKQTPSMEQLLVAFQEHAKIWKSELAEYEKSLFLSLQTKAKECNLQAPSNEFAIPHFVEFVSNYWEKKIVEKIPQRSEDLIAFSLQLLDECPKAIKFSTDATIRDHTRLMKVLKYCKSSTQKIVANKLEEMKQHIQQEDIKQLAQSVLKDSCEYAVIKHKKCLQITEPAVRSIYKVISDNLTSINSHLEAIEKHVEDSIRLVIYSPQLSGSEVMSFLISSQMQDKNPSYSDLDPIIKFQKKQGLLDLHRTLEVDKVNRSKNAVAYSDDLWSSIDFSKNYNFENFKQNLRNSSLRMIDTEADGNSQFRAFAYLVFGHQGVHTAMRLLLMHEILSNPGYYSKFLSNKGIDFQEYVSSMSRENECGDQVTLFAFANFYNAELYLYVPMSPYPIKISPEARTNTAQHEAYYLGYINSNQYAPLLQSASNVEDRLGKLHIQDGLDTSMELDSDIMHTQRPKTVKKEDTYLIPYRATSMRTLADHCIAVICRNIEYLPPLEGALPEELVQKILSLLIEDGKLHHDVLARMLDSSILSLNLENFKRMSPASAKLIGNTCKSLRKLRLANCVGLTSEDLMMATALCHQSLEELNLLGCYLIEDSAIQTIAQKCASLTTVNLSNCSKVADSSVQALTQTCKKLRKLYASGCSQLTDQAFQFVGSELETLDIYECPQLTDATLAHLAKNCPRLMEIRLHGKGITDHGIALLASSCVQLRSVEISNCDSISDMALQNLSNCCPSISTLTVSSCKRITDSAFINSRPLYGLLHIDLTMCLNLTPQTLKAIAMNCPCLQSVNIGSCEELATEDSLLSLGSRCKDLRVLNVSGCIKVTDRVVSAFARNCPKLERVNLYNCNKISDTSLLELANGCPNLLELNLGSCDHISDEGVISLTQGCRNIKVLSLEELKITDRSILSMAQHCQNLENLNLRECKDITNEALLTLAKACPHMNTIDLSYPKNLTIEAVSKALLYWPKLKTLTLRCFSSMAVEGIEHPNLQHLNLSWCKNLVDTAIAKIANGCPSLESLHVMWCSKLTSNSIHTLARKLPNLRLINLRGCNKVSMLMVKHLSATGKIIYN